MRQGALVVDEFPDRDLQAGQVLAEVLACGICGSDLHALAHARPDRRDVHHRRRGRRSAGPTGDGPGPRRRHGPRVLRPGRGRRGQRRQLRRPATWSCSLPIVMDAGGIHAVGYSNDYAGGYAERIVLTDMLTMPVPERARPPPCRAHRADGGRAARGGDEPHRCDGAGPRHAAVVLGCGPVGLAYRGRAAPGRRGDDRRGRLLADPPGPGRHPGRDARWWTRRERARRWRPGAGSTVAGRSWSSRRVGVPGDPRRGHGGRPAGQPRSWWSACACSPTRSVPMIGIGQGAQRPVRAGLRPGASSRTTLRRIAEGEIDVRAR